MKVSFDVAIKRFLRFYCFTIEIALSSTLWFKLLFSLHYDQGKCLVRNAEWAKTPSFNLHFVSQSLQRNSTLVFTSNQSNKGFSGDPKSAKTSKRWENYSKYSTEELFSVHKREEEQNYYSRKTHKNVKSFWIFHVENRVYLHNVKRTCWISQT